MLCPDAMEDAVIPGGKKIWSKWPESYLYSKTIFCDFLKKFGQDFSQLEPLFSCRLCILQNQSRESLPKKWMLLYDNVHFKDSKSPWPFVGLLFDESGALTNKIVNPRQLPKLHKDNFFYFKGRQSLWKLCGLSKKINNPKNYKETMAFLEKNNSAVDVVYTSVRTKRKCISQDWNCPVFPHRESHKKVFVEAFLYTSFKLAFRKVETKKLKANKKIRMKFLDNDDDSDDDDDDNGGKVKKEGDDGVVPKEKLVSNECQKNSRGAVSVQLSGLNQARSLGVLSLEEFVDLSTKLAGTSACFWFELDCKKENILFANYRDAESFYQQDIQGEESWKLFFDYVFKRREKITLEKQNLLQPVLDKLSLFSKCSFKSPWVFCAVSLKACIKKMKIVLFSSDDSVMHALKLHFCNYAMQKRPKYFKGVWLNSDAKNDLAVMQIPEMILFNFGSYLKLDLKNVLPPPFLRAGVANIKHQPVQETSGLGAFPHCQQRGEASTQLLLEAWANFGKSFMTFFQFDIFSMSYMSLSALSFKAIWQKCARIGGTYHQGLEKTKLFYEDVLRQHSTGGFSHSCQDRVECGKPLHADEAKTASSICELDICSSYGYAASNMCTPTGFCMGYRNDGNNKLVCTDPVQRFQSFEFLSVYYTLHQMDAEVVGGNGVDSVLTVFSNFHQNGTLRIEKMPVDLAVIRESGKVVLFNFDGEYAHGCRAGCPSLKSYVGGKSRKELEEFSELRDELMNDWCKAVNFQMQQDNFATYQLITSCHHSQYELRQLKRAFLNVPILSRLTDVYLKRSVLSQDEALFCGENLTYIAFVKGRVPVQPPLSKPLLVREKDKKWNRHFSTDSVENVIMTKDYFNYLSKQHNFRVEKIDRIFFYKRCDILPNIFRELIETRALGSTGPGEKQMLKNAVNFACGFFGFNETKTRGSSGKCRLFSKVSRRARNLILNVQEVGKVGGRLFLMGKNVNPHAKISERKPTMSALPVYVTITEFGKLRLASIMCFLEKHIAPEDIRFLYSNVDNVLLALSTDSIDDAVADNLKESYLAKKPDFFSVGLPGHVKEEFLLTSEQAWKFVSGMTQNYALLAKDTSKEVHKNSALNKLSTQQAYRVSCAILDGQQMVVSQTRRVNKMLNTDHKTQDFTFNKVNLSKTFEKDGSS